MFDKKINEFLHFLKFEKRYSTHTLTAYKQDLLQFNDYLNLSFQNVALKDISHFHLRSWFAGIKADKQTSSTINRKMSSLSTYFNFLIKQGDLLKNPVKLLHAQKLPVRLPIYLKETETEFLLDEVEFDAGFKGITDRMICELLYNTGIRRNELLQLKETDVEWSLKQLRILGKGNKERLVPLSMPILDSLKFYIHEKRKLETYNTDYLLILDSGQPLYAMYIYRIVKHYLTIATTLHKKSPHVLRHTFATHLLQNGANIVAIKDLLGHSSLAATQVYTHNTIDKLKEIHRQSHPRG